MRLSRLKKSPNEFIGTVSKQSVGRRLGGMGTRTDYQDSPRLFSHTSLELGSASYYWRHAKLSFRFDDGDHTCHWIVLWVCEPAVCVGSCDFNDRSIRCRERPQTSGYSRAAHQCDLR